MRRGLHRWGAGGPMMQGECDFKQGVQGCLGKRVSLSKGLEEARE